MKAIYLLLLVSVFTFAQSVNNDDEKIRQIIKQQENAWNKGDAKEYVQSFIEEGFFTIITGTVFNDRSALEERVAFIFSTVFKGSKLTQNIRETKFVGENVCILQVETEMKDYKGLPPGVKASQDHILRTSMLQVLMRVNDEWKVFAFHNVDVKVP